MIKTCNKCKIKKDINDFYQRKGSPDGYRNECKQCRITLSIINYIDNKDKKKHYNFNYNLINKGKLKIQRKVYYEENKETIIRRQVSKTKVKYQNDIVFKITSNLRSRLKNALKNNQKSGSAVRDLGCSVDFFKSYIEQKFHLGMSWKNYGYNGWHLDHIIPLSWFDLTDREQFLKACHYTNLQPLWAIDNLKKSDKVTGAD